MRVDAVTVWAMLLTPVGGCGGSSLSSGRDAGSGGTGGAATGGMSGSGGAGGMSGSGGAAGTSSGGTSGSAAFCSRALGTDCSAGSQHTPICTLDAGIGYACNPCGAQDAGQFCNLKGALVRGTQYSYIQILNVDFAWIYVYDQNQRLVAELDWTANSAVAPWSCVAGPPDFDPSEAMSRLPVTLTASELLCAM